MNQPVLEARQLTRIYHRQGLTVPALRELSLSLAAGSLTAVVGRSGSGKSTLGRCLALAEPLDAGEIWLEGESTRGLEGVNLATARRKVQLVMQDPARSVHPRFTIFQAVSEPLLILGHSRQQRLERAAELLRAVGLEPSLLQLPARSLSGGQIQRLVFARALACSPRILILDESFSGLDLSLRAHLIELLLSLLETHGLTCVLISHDLDLVDHLADVVITLEEGGIKPLAQ